MAFLDAQLLYARFVIVGPYFVGLCANNHTVHCIEFPTEELAKNFVPMLPPTRTYPEGRKIPPVSYARFATWEEGMAWLGAKRNGHRAPQGDFVPRIPRPERN